MKSDHPASPQRPPRRRYDGRTLPGGIPHDLFLLLGLPWVLLLPVSLLALAVPFETRPVLAMAAGFAASLYGAARLAQAKWPLYRAGRFFTFGWAALPAEKKRACQRAWCWILGGWAWIGLWLWAA